MGDSSLLCRLEEIPDGGAISRSIESATGGFQIILLRQGREVFAYHNECPHQGRHLDYVPGKFLIKNGQIICAAHGATFAVASGGRISGPCSTGLVRFPVLIEGDEVRLAKGNAE